MQSQLTGITNMYEGSLFNTFKQAPPHFFGPQMHVSSWTCRGVLSGEAHPRPDIQTSTQFAAQAGA